MKKYIIGTGDIFGTNQKQKYFTPVGETKIKEKKATKAKFGPVFLRLDFYRLAGNNHGKSNKPYMIHGPESGVNNFCSKGCVRMYEKDLLELYNIINEGDKVYIIPYSSDISDKKQDESGRLSPVQFKMN